MRMILDGKKLPLTLRTSKDLLLLTKTLAKELHWRTLYDPAREIIYLSTVPANAPLTHLTVENSVVEELESVRLQGKTICLDPGHGKGDTGAVGPGGTCEKDNTLAVAMLLKEKLINNGASVIMTHNPANERSAEDTQPNLDERLQLINDSEADFFISIHNDAFADHTASGTTTFHYGDAASMRLAEALQKALTTTLETKDRGCRFASFALLRFAQIPGVLIETAFISNPEEEVLLASSDGREKIAAALFAGIAQYFKV